MKRTLIIIFSILGMVIGIPIGASFANNSALSFLSLGADIGFKAPVVLDLGFLEFTIGIWFTINVLGVICAIVFAVISKVVLDWLKI